MKREDQIIYAAKSFEKKEGFSPIVMKAKGVNSAAGIGFLEGAVWADEHPNAIDMAYLQNWYQDSIDETKEPIWTDKHLEELFNDFYLIPKGKE